MFFKRIIILFFSACFILPAVILHKNPEKSKLTASAHDTLQLISNHLNAAKEIFKFNYEHRHKVTIDYIKVEMKPEVFEGSYFNSGIVPLTFSFKEGDQTVSSSVLMKVPNLGIMFHLGEKMLYYQKEKFIYEKVIPIIYKNVPYEEQSPNFYGSTESGILILEDLRQSGYHGFPKSTLMNLPECEAVWKSLAQFHALSTRSINEITTQIDSLTIMDRCHNQWAIEIFPLLMEKFKKHIIPLCSNDTKMFLDYFFVDICPTHINPAFSPRKAGHNVILHGDIHLSNILFKYGPSNEIKCKFIDFQLSRRGSPVIDLMYFTIISIHHEVFDQNRDLLFNLYVQEFNSTLEKIGSFEKNFYTLDVFKTDWEIYRNYFFYVLIGVAPLVWVGNFNTSSQNGEENSFDKLFKSEIYRSAFDGWIKHLLPTRAIA